ncbi:MAG: hypothetical protein WC455_15755 [Dehalococcoidia bacterium]|jgi:hypothetical protein
MCFKKTVQVVDAKPEITFYEVDGDTVRKELLALGLQFLYQLDTTYYYTTVWGWEQAVAWVRKTYKFPKYTDQKFDCDDFAILMKGLISSEFGLSTCAFIIGNEGRHAFNLCRVGTEFPATEWKMLEPQTGEWRTNYTCQKCLL